MRILITGAFGFVGLGLVQGLAVHPEVTVIAADLRPPDAATLACLEPVRERVQVFQLDVTDRGAVRAALADHAPTHVIHAAALTPTRSQEAANPTPIVDVNLGGAVNVLDAALGSPQLERLLLVSSSGVYGAPPPAARPVQGEAGPLALDGLYAITKYSAELLGARYQQLSDKWIASVRLSAIYGPREMPSASRPRMSQIGELLHVLRAGRGAKVAGPEVARDWTHVADVAGALWALLTAPQWRHDVYNVSCGRAHPFREVVACFQQHGLQAEWVADPAAADIAMHPDHARLPLDITRLREDTSFTPQYGLAQGIAALVG
jgi:nucleoside-diphosphate-sugar epimerase